MPSAAAGSLLEGRRRRVNRYDICVINAKLHRLRNCLDFAAAGCLTCRRQMPASVRQGRRRVPLGESQPERRVRVHGSPTACRGSADVLPVFVPAPPASDRAYWTGLPDRLTVAIDRRRRGGAWRAVAGPDGAAPIAPSPTTGNRVGYESAYFARRRRINALALAEAVEGKGRFVDALIDGIVAGLRGKRLAVAGAQCAGARRPRTTPCPTPPGR